MSARSRFKLSVAAVLAVLAVGAIGYMVLEADRDVPFRDALYMTVITLSTVGYGEPWELSPPARLWTMGVITFGIATVSYAFGSLVSLVVGGELHSLREKMKMEKAIEHLHGHVILCGFGRMGALIAQELHRRKVPLVIVEKDAGLESAIRDSNLPYMIADATEDETLDRAGLRRARALVIALPNDADNVFLTLTVRSLQPDLEIIARAEHPSTEGKLKRAGATRVVCPQATGAKNVADILTRPTVVDFVELANHGVDLELGLYQIVESSPLAGKTLREFHVRVDTDAVAVAIKRADGQAIVNPDADAVLAAGDTMILVGSAGVACRLDSLGSTP